MRLTVEAIREAFEKTGMKPVKRTFGGVREGCGMQAYAQAHIEMYGGMPRKVSLLSTGHEYFEGFTTGWDYGKTGLSDERLLTQYGGVEGAMRYFEGLEDGRAAAHHMFASEDSPVVQLA